MNSFGRLSKTQLLLDHNPTFYFYLSTGEARLSTRAAQRTSFLIGTLGAIGFGVDELVYVGLLSTFYFYLSTGEASLSTGEARVFHQSSTGLLTAL
jgi:hypothetical protein